MQDWGQHVVITGVGSLERDARPTVKKPALSLCAFLAPFTEGEVDACHVDIQGFEARVFASCMPQVHRKVRGIDRSPDADGLIALTRTYV